MKNIIYFIILAVFSIFINQYFGYRGVFPIDSFVNYDPSYNITAGNHPFKDYWTITGPFLDYIQGQREECTLSVSHCNTGRHSPNKIG